MHRNSELDTNGITRLGHRILDGEETSAAHAKTGEEEDVQVNDVRRWVVTSESNLEQAAWRHRLPVNF